MYRKLPFRLFAPLLLLAFLMTVITGCGAKIEPAPTPEATASAATPSTAPTAKPAPTDAPSQTAEPTSEPTAAPTSEPSAEPGNGTGTDEKPVKEPIVNADGSTTVFTVEQLLNALAPGKVIELAEGVYNFTSFSSAFDQEPSADFWFYDWGTLTLCDLNDVVIRARDGERVELVTEESYADALKLENCENVRLEGMIMGHAVEPGRCIGGVLELSYCKDIRLQDLDLYGCGTYGLVADHSFDVYAGACVIRECSYGIMDLRLCSSFVFNGCTMRDCRGFEQLCISCSTVEFQHCEFTGNESEYGFLPPENNSDILFSYCAYGSWELEQLEQQTPEYSRVVFAQDENMPCGYATVWPTSIEELVEAIKPNTMIRLWEMPHGTYDLSAYLEKVWDEEGDAWNRRHEYVQILECYDGLELQIRNCSGLSIIEYLESAEYEFTVDPRYATVLSFVGCDDLTLRGFTLGHTEPGECYGNVLAFDNCRRVVLRDLDIYGCGYFGLELSNHCGYFSVFDTVIRDCSAGPISVEYCDGDITFLNCTLTGSSGGGYYWGEEWELPSFLRCTFGAWETTELMFREDIQTDQCIWSSDIMGYPDYDWEHYDVDPANAVAVPFDAEILTTTYWIGWQYTETDTGITVSLPDYEEDGSSIQYVLTFTEDGSGVIQCSADAESEELPFTWVCVANYAVDLFFDDTGVSQASVSLYREELSESDFCMWLRFVTEEIEIWFY